MLFYYPLEHLYYLRTHDIIPFSVALRLPFARKPMSIELNATKLALWSTRAWAVYLVLQFYHLREDFLLWKAQQKALLRVKDPSIEYDTEKRNLSQRWDAMLNELIGSMANLPLAVHWYVMLCLFPVLACSVVSPGHWKMGCLRMMYAVSSSVFYVRL